MCTNTTFLQQYREIQNGIQRFVVRTLPQLRESGTLSKKEAGDLSAMMDEGGVATNAQTVIRELEENTPNNAELLQALTTMQANIQDVLGFFNNKINQENDQPRRDLLQGCIDQFRSYADAVNEHIRQINS